MPVPPESIAQAETRILAPVAKNGSVRNDPTNQTNLEGNCSNGSNSAFPAVTRSISYPDIVATNSNSKACQHSTLLQL